MTVKHGPFDSQNHAKGFMYGIDYANSFYGESGIQGPTAETAPYQLPDTPGWWVDVEIPDEA